MIPIIMQQTKWSKSLPQKKNEAPTARVDDYDHHAVENASLSSVEKAGQSSNTGVPENIVHDSNSEATSKELTDGKKANYVCLTMSQFLEQLQ